MNSPAFRPIGDRYLVLPDEQQAESETVEGITLTTKKDPHKVSTAGTIVAKGKTCTEPLEPGDRVAYGLFSGYDQTVDGTLFKVLQERELLGELLRTPFDENTNGAPIPAAYLVSDKPTHILTITEAPNPTHPVTDDDIPW